MFASSSHEDDSCSEHAWDGEDDDEEDDGTVRRVKEGVRRFAIVVGIAVGDLLCRSVFFCSGGEAAHAERSMTCKCDNIR